MTEQNNNQCHFELGLGIYKESVGVLRSYCNEGYVSISVQFSFKFFHSYLDKNLVSHKMSEDKLCKCTFLHRDD